MNRLIASNRAARYAIVIASDATEQERYAADELRYYLERMTSAPIGVTADVPADGRYFAVGASPSAALDVEDSALGEDGFIVKKSRPSRTLKSRTSRRARCRFWNSATTTIMK